MTDKLKIYNDALLALGERKLASLSEEREPRRALDDAFDEARLYCLEQGFWNFALRTVELAPEAGIVPAFGFTHAFGKPADWVRTWLIADNEQFEPALLRYKDEGAYWYADHEPLFVRYVSGDAAFGLDLSLWPQSYATYVSARLARKICFRITGSDGRVERLEMVEKKALASARSTDAMNEPPGFFPAGSWVRSRGAGLQTRSRWNGESA